MPVHIERPAMVEGRLEFQATDDGRELSVSVSINLWERLQAVAARS